MAKLKPKKHTKARSPSKVLQIVAATLVVVAVATVGTYIVVRGYAQSEPVPNNAIVISAVGPKSEIDFKKGSIPLYAYMPSAVFLNGEDQFYGHNPQQPAVWHVSVRLGMNVKITDVICATGYTCQIDSQSYDVSQNAINNGQMQAMYLCVNLKQQDYDRGFTLMTFKVDPSTAVKNTRNARDYILIPTAERGACLTPSQLGTSAADNNWTNSTYDQRTYAYQDSSGAGGYHPLFGWSMGVWGAGSTPSDGDGSTGDGGTGSGTGTGGTGTGTNGTGSGSGGGGGSSANQQSDEQNVIPDSSAQGDAGEQASIIPSPFYDGKQYFPGSDTDKQGLTAVFSGAHKQAAYGITSAAVIVIAATGMALFWRLRRTKPKTLRKNR